MLTQLLFCLCKQLANGTIFLAELSVMPGLSDMTVTTKWVINSLLYDNGHLIFMEILKYAMFDFIRQVESQMEAPSQPTTQHVVDPSPHKPSVQEKYRPTNPPLPPSKTQPRTTTISKDETEDEDDDAMDARDYLSPSPAIDASKFEQVWASSSAMYVASQSRQMCAECGG